MLVETLPPKRKRGSTVETTTEKNENVTKPPRAMSSGRATAPTTKTRGSRSKTSLSKIEESTEEEEEEAQAPVRKKIRPSVDAGAEDGSDGKPVKRTQTRRLARSSVKKEADGDDQVLSQPPKRPPSKRRTAASQTITTPDTVLEELEGEDVKVRTHDRRSRDILDENVERADVPSNNSKEGHPRASKARVSFATPTKEQKVDEDVDVETYPIRKSQRPLSPSQAKPTQLQADEEGGREEFHLVDPIPMPAPETLAQSIHEQSSGPQTRLVIHKIVLVNFKSYAGRQIIGPFHKVRAQFY